MTDVEAVLTAHVSTEIVHQLDLSGSRRQNVTECEDAMVDSRVIHEADRNTMGRGAIGNGCKVVNVHRPSSECSRTVFPVRAFIALPLELVPAWWRRPVHTAAG